MKLTTIADRKTLIQNELARIVGVLKGSYHPQKIILFGSAATGEIHEWSDIDLLIIKETSKRPLDRSVEVAGLVKPKVGLDIFVYTPQEFELLQKEGISFVRNILNTGKILYEKRG